jgi:galactosamine-6-phosphate isomerase
MQVFIADTYKLMSKQVAGAIAEIIQPLATPLVCVASGDSPKGLYREWQLQQKKKIIDVHNWYFVGLDEWVGLDENDEGSCRYMLNTDVFHPLDIQPGKICCFDGKATDTAAECDRIENYIHENKTIDVAILGLGMNGHIGLNEPGTSALEYSHVSTIHPVTKKVGQKYFSRPQSLTEGITLGLATLMEAKHLILIVSGQKKAAILKEALEGPVTEQVPASLLRHHSGFKVYADKEAANLLKPE